MSARIILLAVWTVSLMPRATPQQHPPLNASSFVEIAAQGFGDRQNSWAWSMSWFQGKLYVGTLRSYSCVTSAAIDRVVPQYPPSDPDIECTPDADDLPLAAEIWSWSPDTEAWSLAFRSPMDLPIPDTSKFTARDIGFRGMQVFSEPGGVEALYVATCSPKGMYPWAPAGRLLRTTDGVSFAPVPQTPGSVLGYLANACFRGMDVLNGKLYVLAGTFQGAGVVLESATPWLGDDAFCQITPSEAKAYEIAAFSGQLYITFDHKSGFGLYRTDAQGSPPYSFSPVIIRGGYKEPHGNPSALSRKEFKGSLYIGGNSAITRGTCIIKFLNFLCLPSLWANGGAELFRVHPDDTWDLVVGESRNTSIGFKPSLSGFGPGFNWNLNQHLWRLEVFDERLYVGTYDVATELRTAGSPIADFQGFDLWFSTEGEQFTPIDLKGFGHGFDYGARTLLSTPTGLFLGTANPFYGLRIYRANPE